MKEELVESMELKKAILWFIFLIVLLLSSSREMVPGVEGKLCRVRGARRHCLTDHTCDNVCTSEGFVRGKCDGILRRCHCDRQC
ncbi:hypothetical protein KFK09_021899 [Dendrobium nobile]|uniref:Knottins-like domain-containing protein n=1 Tax=Dendrobium nobile TaxID=94219 RepID=A0A8T3AHR1_DENNO|nr:hypothetical protein KFK09_021895 [Dendrobium nobile]KAI0495597.1 hypothetical protein KFK09_021899 [Dendrobium nobile]